MSATTNFGSRGLHYNKVAPDRALTIIYTKEKKLMKILLSVFSYLTRNHPPFYGMGAVM